MRSGPLPAGVSYNASTRTIAGTAATGTVGTYVQTINASNGTAPNATQTLTIVVVASCGGFSDVDSGNVACNSVEWARNRSITAGCTATAVLPAQRRHASFDGGVPLHRSAATISPLIGITQRTECAAIDSVPIVCAASSDIAPATYPRNIQAFFSAVGRDDGRADRRRHAGLEPQCAARPGNRSRHAHARADQRRRMAIDERTRRAGREAGEAVRFGLSLHREGGTADVNSVRCQIAWMGVNRDGAAPPRDLLVQP